MRELGSMRRLPGAALVLALSAVAAAGEDSKTAAPAQPPAAASPPAEPAASKPGVAWIDGWAAGRVSARDRRCLMLVLLTQEKPPSDACRALDEKLFADPRAAEIAQKCVLVRMDAGDGANAEFRDFSRRYDVRRVPTLLVMNAAGHVIAPCTEMTVDGVLRALAVAAIDEHEFADWARMTEPAAREMFREQLLHRMAWDELIPLYTADAAAQPTVDAFDGLVVACYRAGRGAAEAAALTRAIEAFPGERQCVQWKLRLAVQPLDALADKPEERAEATLARLAPLAKERAEAHDAEGEALVRLALAQAQMTLHRGAAAKAEFDAVLRLAPLAPTAPAALLGTSALLRIERDYSHCKAACDRIVKEFASSPEASAAAQTLRECEGRIDGK